MFLSTRLARGDRGSLAPSVAAIIIVLFLLGGLVIDGARALGARSRAAAYAEEGARIAGQAVTFDAGELELDARAISTNADAYCARISAHDDGVESCSVNPTADGDIVFRVRLSIDKGILGMVTSDPTMTFVGEGRAIAEIGITEAQGGVQDPPDISGSRIVGNSVDPNVDEASDAECASPRHWPEGDADGFAYWQLSDYYAAAAAIPPTCLPMSPVCPNQDPPDENRVELPRELRDTEVVSKRLLRTEGERWNELYAKCRVVEGLLYEFAEPDKEYCKGHQEDPLCPEPEDCETQPGKNPLCPTPDECLDTPQDRLCPEPRDCDGPGQEHPLCPPDDRCAEDPGHPLCPELPPNSYRVVAAHRAVQSPGPAPGGRA